MKNFQKYMDLPTFIVAIVTFLLFTIALFTKAFLHDLLLEAAVFLVSLKLIMGFYKLNAISKRIESKLDKIQDKLNS